MKLSIIIPTLNEGSLIGMAISRAYGLNPHEVIVVDGGSRDDTVEAARKTDALVLEAAAGRAHQQNAGAKYATGDLLLFLHADCWLEPSAAAQIQGVVNQNDYAAGAFRQKIDADGFLYRWLEWGNSWRVRYQRMAYGDQGILIRKSLFDAVGGFPDVPLMEDVYLMRLLRKRTRIALLPGPLHTSARRWQKHGVIRQTTLNWSIIWAERLGVSTDRLARWYYPNRKLRREGIADE